MLTAGWPCTAIMAQWVLQKVVVSRLAAMASWTRGRARAKSSACHCSSGLGSSRRYQPMEDSAWEKAPPSLLGSSGRGASGSRWARKARIQVLPDFG